MSNDMRTCSTCKACRECGCHCSTRDERAGISWIKKRRPTFHEANFAKGELKINRSKRFISAEIEVCGLAVVTTTRVDDAIKKWGAAVVSDGSLPDRGFEINTAPASGDLFIQEITEICGALKKQGAFVGSRAGLHIHIDARDMKYYDIRRLILLYARIEAALFDIVAPSRCSSSYCMPCAMVLLGGIKKKDQKGNKEGILSSVYGEVPKPGAMKQLRRNKVHDNRYRALNLHSWFHRGTIECRMHHGTVDAEKIINWGLLWAGILDTAKRLKEEEIESLRGSSYQVLLSCCPSEAVREYVMQRTKYFQSNPSPEADDTGEI